MAQVSGVFSARSRYSLVLTVTQSSQNVSANTSIVAIDLRINETAENGSFSLSAPLSWSWNVNGQTASGSSTYDFRAYDVLVLSSTSRTIAHNSDGTKSISFSASAGGGTIIGSASCSGSMSLTTIPRASTPSVVGGNTFDAGETVTINTNRASTSFTHTIQYSFGSSGWVTIATGVTTSTTWTPPLSLLSYIPNSPTGTGTLRAITYSGSTVIGTKDVSFTLVAPADVLPTWTSVSVSENVAAVAANVGAYVQGVSKLNYAITGAAGVYSSTISLQRFSVDGQVISGATGTTPNPISSSGTVPVTWLIQDSRGRQLSQTSNITVLPYVKPTFVSCVVNRALSDGTVDVDEGTYIRVDLNAVVQSLMNVTQRNSIQIRVYSRIHSTGGAWTLKTTLNPGGISYNSFTTVPGPFSVDESYDILVEVIDKFNTSSFQTSIAVAAVFMHWDENGLGIGKYRENGILDVNGDIYAEALQSNADDLSLDLNAGGGDVQVGNSSSTVTLSGQVLLPTLPEPVFRNYTTAVNPVTAASWASAPGISTVVMSFPFDTWVLVEMGAWMSAPTGDLRTGVEVSGATSIDPQEPSEGAGVALGTWGSIMWVANVYEQRHASKLIRCNAGTNTFTLQAYSTGSGTRSLNYQNFIVIPQRFAL